jgi:LmbE family N-acetylglucosaminyl deacetylase
MEAGMKTPVRKRLLAYGLLTAALLPATAQNAPPVPPPDDRYKADILLVIAHPDDDTNVSTYLWKAVLDEGKRVAVVFTTRGNSGVNAVGTEQSKALADIREVEARQSLAAHGISNVWFLHASDTPTQDVLHSLATVGHGEALEEVVRIVRLTRPEVILTWLPAYVFGENHGDHQAAAVLATEAFDLAGSPTAFPEQIAAPRDRLFISNYGEGLHRWQVKKLYFFSDATRPEFLAHLGPSYLATDICRSKGVPFSQLNRMAWDFYRTQIDFGEEGMRSRINAPEYLMLGKSSVSAPVEADVLAGVGAEPIPYAPPPRYQETPAPPLSLELGGPWAFYREFYAAHGLISLEGLVKPQSAFIPDHPLWIPLFLRNTTHNPVEVVLHSRLPEGWTPPAKDITYQLEPESTYPAQIFLKAPAEPKNADPQLLRWDLTADGKPVGEVELTVYPEEIGLPQ